MPKITVIMPSLNVINYIEQCMESVLGQTLQDIEILAIDAGSTDGTLEILREYEKKDERVKVICSEVKSYGFQLNLGISQAVGEYVGIVETDDVIVSDMYEALYVTAEKFQADYVKGTARAFYEDEVLGEINIPIDAIGNMHYEYINGIAEIGGESKPFVVLADFYLWNGIYKKELIKGIRLNESKGAAYQDVGFMLQAQIKAERLVYIDKEVYCYRRDNPYSSCYNKKAFRYIAQEYDYVESIIDFPNDLWRKTCYQKMFKQTKSRFMLMAESENYWEEAVADIEVIGRKISNAISNNLLCERDFFPEEWEELQLIKNAPRILFEKYADIYKNKRLALQNIWNTIVNKDIVIVTCGRIGCFFQALLQRKFPNVKVVYCDNMCKDDMVHGINVYKPEQVASLYPDAAYVIATNRYREVLMTQLLDLKISEQQVINYTLGVDVDLLKIASE